MSLNWEITNCKDWEKISMKEENGRDASITNALIWATMSIGLPGITEKNVSEFYWRAKVLEREDGAFVRHFDGKEAHDVLLTRADIDRRIGLATNVSTEARRVWVARQLKRWTRDRQLTEAQQKELRAAILSDAPPLTTRKAKARTTVSKAMEAR